MAGVASRTRSKNIPLFGSLSLDGSCSLKQKRRISDVSVSESKKRKPNEESLVLHGDVNVICIDSDEEGDEEWLGFVDEKISEGYVEEVERVGNGDVEALEDCQKNSSEGCVDAFADEVGDEDWLGYLNKKKFGGDIDVNNDEVENGGEGGLEDCEKNSFEGCVVVENGVESEKNGGIGELVEKDGSFEDEKCGLISENLIIDSDDETDDGEDEPDDDDDNESEEIETSDEEFLVDEVNEVSDSDNSTSSYVDEDDDGEKEKKKKKGRKNKEEEKEEVEEEEKEVDWQEHVLAEMVREAKGQNSEISERNNEKEEEKEEEEKEEEEEEEEEKEEEEEEENLNMDWQEYVNVLAELEHADDGNVTASYALKEKGSVVPMKGSSSSSSKAKDSVKLKESVIIGDFHQEKIQSVRGLGFSDENGSSIQTKQKEMKGQDYKCRGDTSSGKKMESMDKDGLNQRGKNTVFSDESGSSIQTKQKEMKGQDYKCRGDTSSGKKMESMDKDGLNQRGKSTVFSDENGSSIQTKQKDLKGQDYKCKGDTSSGKKMESMDKDGLNQRGKSTVFMPKELRLVELLAEYYCDNKNDKIQNDSPVLEMKDVIQHDTRPPPVYNEPAPLIWSLKKVEKVQKTKKEEEEEVLWDLMDTTLRELEAESMIGNLGTNEAKQEKMGSPFSDCEHDIRLDEEIGVYCNRCGWVVTDIKDVSPLVIDKFPNEGSGQRASFGDANISHFHDSQFNVSDHNSETSFSYNERTVWDLIPDVKQTLYSHQQEGFEFIWNKLVGNVELQALKNANPRREGGCIISHAPGTGKTKLTIMFLKAYLKVFPKCLPVIVAPAGLLLTWEDEFKKWDIGVPFHNLNNPDLSVKEHADVVNATNWSNTRLSRAETRMAKLILWFKETSILGISYSLYEKLAGEGKCKDKKKGEFKDNEKNNHASAKKIKEKSYMRKALLEAPGLLVLDEGHTPRNARSLILKVLSKIQTKKRIMLSGTPFQNNFLELYNTLSLVKPSFPNTIPHKLKKFCQERKKAVKELSWEPVTGNSTTGNTSDDKIRHLKLLVDPIVHVHKGAVLQKKLPGLRNCVLRLKPESFQKQILESIQSSRSVFNFERKLIMASVHPSLFLECKLLEEEESVVDKVRLEKLRLNPYAGAKTKFLVEFVNLCVAFNEKVLVFSQYIGPLRLIVEQLNASFNWTEGKEMLYMVGGTDLKEKQSLIHNFNDANSQAKILLACTKACCEGISLVGASRVVLLDVLWNPSVERQAISRAYRIGQKRVVYTYHLLMHETAECVKYCKQAEKDRLSELVFSAKNPDNEGEKNCAVNLEDGVLDLMLQHEKLKDMFVECVVQSKERDLVESVYY